MYNSNSAASVYAVSKSSTLPNNHIGTISSGTTGILPTRGNDKLSQAPLVTAICRAILDQDPSFDIEGQFNTIIAAANHLIQGLVSDQ